jgi:hypothetical protein
MDLFKRLLFNDYFVFLIFFLLGILELLVIFIIVQVRKRKIRHWISTKAVVIDLATRRGSKGGTVYCPVFEFNTQSGETIVHHSKIGSKPQYYSKGMEVVLFYNPENPNRYVVKGDRRIKFIFTILTLSAAVMLIIGLGGLVQFLLNYIKISKG